MVGGYTKFSVSYVLHQEEHTLDGEFFFIFALNFTLGYFSLCAAMIYLLVVHLLPSNSTLSPSFTTSLLHLLESCHVLSLLPLDPVLSSLQDCILVVNTIWPLASMSRFARPLQSSFWGPSYNPVFDNNLQDVPC